MNHHSKIGEALHSPPTVHTSGDHRSVVGAQEEPFLDLALIAGFFRRQWPVIALFILGAVALAVAYLFMTPARYTATSVLMLDTRRLQLFQQQSVLSEFSFDAPAVDSQLEVLKSRAVALSVIDTLNLVKDPEFTGDVTSSSGSLTSAITALVKSAETETLEPQSQEALIERAIDYFQDHLTVRRVGRSYVIEISFQSLDEEKASRIANAIGKAYILDQLQANYTATRLATNWLKDRIEELRQEAERADRLTLDFRNKNNLTDAGGKLLSEQQLSEINTQLIVAKAQTAEAKARLDRILDISRRGIDDAAVGDSLQNTVLNQLQQQYLEAARREADFSTRYGADHPAAANLRKEMQQIQNASKAEMNRIAESYKSDYEIARSREQTLQASLDALTVASAGTREAQVGLRLLESSANAYRTLHDNFLQRFVEATQQQSFPNTEARLITEAATAERTHPRTKLVLGLAVVLGAGLGCAIAFAREGLDRVFRTARQVEQALGVECLGVIPAIEGASAHTPLEGDSLPQIGPRSITADLGIARQVVLAPFSRFSETIRAIKVAADTCTTAHGVKVIGLVSALAGEGKSTIASNLAQLIAHSGRRVLLIDADLRTLSLSRRMTPYAEAGIFEVLIGGVTLSDAVWHDPITKLDFLPAVLKSPIAHTSEILASDRMASLLASARDLYEYVIVDFTPLAPVVDAKAAARHMDAFVLVIEWGQTSPEAIFEALGSAEVVHSKLLGAVLNKANAARLKKLEAYKGRSYHSYYHSSSS
ncbi:polysaccharide biosynthesis tyrosine autokinase [Microvirga sp. TS319]|uniref:polysaccharide biosynthesis tyrosine autokinase n=1 Tax=Microvirga sp. TS319 TaxID=3241165 RepID=UPI00351A1B7D